MFFRQPEKKESTEPNATQLFSMEKIGLQIMHARKKKGMTQMELADRIGISFQAVSNWERGLSCPDISKLFELSELFDISIDELLGNRRAAQIATEIQDGTPPALPMEELTAVAPLLDQEQADQIMQKSLLPEETPEPEEPASEPSQTDANANASGHASANTSGHVSASDRMQSILPLLPYASEETVRELAMSILNETHDLNQIQLLLQYMDENDVGILANTYLEATHDLNQIRPLLPYMYENEISRLAKLYLEATHDLNQIQPLLQYMYEDDIGRIAKQYVNATHSLEQIQPLLQYMDEDDVSELAKTYLKATRDLNQIKPLLPYMDEDAVDELLRSLLK